MDALTVIRERLDRLEAIVEGYKAMAEFQTATDADTDGGYPDADPEDEEV